MPCAAAKPHRKHNWLALLLISEGGYNVADPKKGLLDWVYLGRHIGSMIHTDDLGSAEA
jgi:hypothetical protein